MNDFFEGVDSQSGPNGWEKWGNHVLYQLNQNAKHHDDTNKRLAHIQSTLDQMKGASRIKMAVFSIGVPAVVAIIGTVLTLFFAK